MLVKELMQTKVYFVKADTPVTDVIGLMKNYNIGIIPVCSNTGALIGVITDRDIVLNYDLLSSSDKDCALVTAGDIMSDNTATVNGNTEVHDAAMIFSKRKVRRLPVLENGKLAGMLSISDLAKKRIYLAEVGEIIGSLSE